MEVPLLKAQLVDAIMTLKQEEVLNLFVLYMRNIL